ncbi:hypothetical protein OIU74_030173 [Salix koriyanagi]|uniref:Uncharacterized protein n=1 Tax=Salix koriyanagi TaxID=2511006 RepID=A0A9Q0VFK5_9ROSI|nr:hypothetical protein OIU74_030173 [Salix koriyanagi]
MGSLTMQHLEELKRVLVPVLDMVSLIMQHLEELKRVLVPGVGHGFTSSGILGGIKEGPSPCCGNQFTTDTKP